jgi:purine-binding chemotaxis protein CheW
MNTAIAEPLTNLQSAASASNDAGRAARMQVVTFRLANEYFAIDILQAREITRPGLITKLPEVPECISGLMNLGGEVIPIVDTRKRCGLPARVHDEQTRIIVARAGGKTIGMIVDAVMDMPRIAPEQIEPPHANGDSTREFVRGLIHIDHRTLTLLNADHILPCEVQPAGDVGDRATSAVRTMPQGTSST